MVTGGVVPIPSYFVLKLRRYEDSHQLTLSMIQEPASPAAAAWQYSRNVQHGQYRRGR